MSYERVSPGYWRLTACPSCEADLGDLGDHGVAEHIADHDPEDFGLTPLGDRDPSALKAARDSTDTPASTSA